MPTMASFVVWEVQTDKGWVAYDAPVSALLEDDYLAGHGSTVVAVRLVFFFLVGLWFALEQTSIARYLLASNVPALLVPSCRLHKSARSPGSTRPSLISGSGQRPRTPVLLPPEWPPFATSGGLAFTHHLW